MEEEEPLDSHVIELATTRPLMVPFFYISFLGEVPFTAAVLLFGGAGLCYTAFGLKYSLWLPFAWLLVSKLVENNYHGITHFQKYLETGNLFCLTRKKGGVSVTPFPADKSKLRGMI